MFLTEKQKGTGMWAETEFKNGLQDFHGRNRSSLIRAGEEVYKNIGSSFSKALGNTFRQSIATIFSKPAMDTEKILEGHIQATVARCSSSEGQVLIVSQDTTFYNYSGHQSLSGLGFIQGKIKGTLQHNVLAMDETGIPLGLLYQKNWTRGGLNALENESDKWQEGLRAVNTALAGIDKKVVLVQDREADILNFFKAERGSNVDLLVRVFQPRNIEIVAKEEVHPLQDAVGLLSEQGILEVEVKRNNRPIKLGLEVKSGKVAVLPNKGLSAARNKAKDLYLVVARETNAFDKEGKSVFDPKQAACWMLLTTCLVEDAKQAFEVVRWYALRWRVEQFHFVLKSGGFKVEKLQFDDVHTLFNGLAFYSIIAWRVLYLNYLVRKQPQAPAKDYFEPLEIKLLQAKAEKPVATLQEAIRSLGFLVNFQSTKKQPLPGVKVMGEALIKLQHMVEAIQLYEKVSLQD